MFACSFAWLTMTFAAAAAPTPSPVCPAPDALPWIEVASDHFVILTDADPEVADEAILHLERYRTAIAGAGFGGKLESPARAHVVMFRRTIDFRELMDVPEGEIVPAGYFTIVGQRPYLVLPGGRVTPWTSGTLRHELAHELSFQTLLRQPRWFAEGIAQFLAAIDVNEGGSRPVATLGLSPPPWNWTMRVPAKRLLDWDCDSQEHAGPCYLSAWWMVHYLLNERPKEMATFQGKLAEGVEPAAAWKAAFPDLDPATPGALERLDDAVSGHAKLRREVTVRRFTFDDPVVRSARRTLACAEVRALLAELQLTSFRKDRAETRRRFDVHRAAALQMDPTGRAAWRTVYGDGKPASLAEAARVATREHPEDWRSWWIAFNAVSEDAHAKEERTQAMERLAELAPAEPLVLNVLAWEFLQDGASGRALPLARRAVRLAPGSAATIDTLAMVQADLGMCDAARLSAERAIELVKGSDAEPSYRERLGKALTACSGGE